MANRELRQFDKNSLAKTEKAWSNDLKKSPELFPGDIARIFAFAKQDFAKQDKNDLAYGVFKAGSDIAESVVQIVVTKEGKKFVKMLDCFVRPSIYEKAMSFNEAAIDDVVEVYMTSITGTIQIGDDHKANAIKVYGRSHALLTVLTIVAKHLKDSFDTHKSSVAIEGRWLVVRPTGKGK